MDSDYNVPLEYATISVFKQNDSIAKYGGLTDLNGKFNFKVLRGKYDIKIEYISFKVKYLKKFIRENKQVITSFIGLPAGTKRGVVDNSYDVSLIVTFNSKEEQEVYQNDPTHISFIDKASNLWKKVQVFDSIKT